MYKVLVISDLHLPYHSADGLNKIYERLEKEEFNAVVQIGDLLDQYVFSNYKINPNVTPISDVKKGLKLAKEMWAKIHKLAPKAQLYQLFGNHDQRLSKRIAEKLPQLAGILDEKSLYQFDHVKTLDSEREYLVLDGVVYCHGWLSGCLQHSKHFNRPVV